MAGAALLATTAADVGDASAVELASTDEAGAEAAEVGEAAAAVAAQAQTALAEPLFLRITMSAVRLRTQMVYQYKTR